MTYKDIQSLPRTDDVTQIQAGDHQVNVVTITPENKKYLLQVALSMYAGEPCRICGGTLTMDDLRNGAVFAGYSADNAARSAHKECWQRSPGIDGKPNPDWIHQ